VAAHATTLTGEVAVDPLMAELQDRVRERLRQQLLRHGASPAFDDPALFAAVDALLRTAADSASPRALVLPELLGDPDTWRLDIPMRYQSHRPGTGPFLIFIKRRLLMPAFRWLFEYSRNNFERQRRMNEVLSACVQELAIETVRLRQEVRALSHTPGPSAPESRPGPPGPGATPGRLGPGAQ
jgi:hypothetical protein